MPLALATAVLTLVAAGCTGSDSPTTPTAAPSNTSATGSTTDAAPPAVTESASPSLPPGARPGLDDYDGDGEPDPTCTTQDFGAGLVLRIPCQIGTANTPENGTRLVKNSLYRLPGATDVDLTGISGGLLLARDVAGAKVVIVVFNSDALFETGSNAIGSTDTLDATIRLINSHYAGGAIQVRGHTDATGSAAVNQPLSVRRAATVRDYLTGHGTRASSVSSVGLGSSQPFAEETNPDGSSSPDGQRFNRRVEIVIRLPAA
ncbi:hypothetical protein FDG2_3772 [Candidatus Protofrankia californiensis]|uniref:OmpA-like domain-containing protein n=1 Tax=Candidatus Protofrankia californiensis TaxID=1839754 RepID=A0A1C3P0Y0_9ACTN|nr:hypothetical protein FDG2_3772 [Candidatus Protofrankia californiensis]